MPSTAPRSAVTPPSTRSRTAFFVAVAITAAFVVLEYAFDWPIHLAR
ncbi:hypothetical protein ACE7GA_10195 [Roseomonas sp. CCTCC AB2023176]